MKTTVIAHFGRRIFLSLLMILGLVFIGSALRAQINTIGFGPSGFTGMPDTVISGAHQPVGAILKNNSDSFAYVDSVQIVGYIDTGAGQNQISFPPFFVSLYPGDSVFGVISIDFNTDTALGGLMRIGGNVIVVWPALYGNSNLGTGDSLTAYVVILDPSGIPSDPPEENDVRCYPVPAQGLLYISSTNPSYKVKEVIVHDMAGRLVARSEDTAAGIDTQSWPPGIYSMEVLFDNGTKRVYKISRQ